MPLRLKMLAPTAFHYAFATAFFSACWLAVTNVVAIDDPAPAPPTILNMDEELASELEAPASPAALSETEQDGFGNPLSSVEGIQSVSYDVRPGTRVKSAPSKSSSDESDRFADLGQLKQLGTLHRITAIVDPSDDPTSEIELGSFRLLQRGTFESLQWASQQQPDGSIPFPDSPDVPDDQQESPSDANVPPEQATDAEQPSQPTPPTPIPPLSIGAMGFDSINAMTIDISTPAAEGDGSLAQPEDQAGPIFERHGDHQEYLNHGNVGLDPAFFLQPAEFCYQPLYFEELNLERYGTCKFPLAQPVLSGAHFFATVPAMPYLMSWKLPRRCYYDTTEYYAGRQAPWQRELPPLRLGPSAVETAAITGAILILP